MRAVDKIRYILEDSHVYESMSKASKTMYEKDFTVEKMAAEYKKVYNCILGKECF